MLILLYPELSSKGILMQLKRHPLRGVRIFSVMYGTLLASSEDLECAMRFVHIFADLGSGVLI